MTDSTNERVPAAAAADGPRAHAEAEPGSTASAADERAGDERLDDERFDDERDRISVAETVSVETVRVRRTPRYARFALVGALVCIAAAFILTYSFPQGAGYDRNSVFGFMVIVAVTVGVALGCIAALIAERITSSRAKSVAADRIDVAIADSARSNEGIQQESDHAALPAAESQTVDGSSAEHPDQLS